MLFNSSSPFIYHNSLLKLLLSRDDSFNSIKILFFSSVLFCYYSLDQLLFLDPFVWLYHKNFPLNCITRAVSCIMQVAFAVPLFTPWSLHLTGSFSFVLTVTQRSLSSSLSSPIILYLVCLCSLIFFPLLCSAIV